jgi:AbrB family looped-hinge helix DNA binding protein
MVEKQAKITTKGQITVPLAIRKALGVGPGDVLLFEGDETGVRVRPVRTKSPLPSIGASATAESAPGRRQSIAGCGRCVDDHFG